MKQLLAAMALSLLIASPPSPAHIGQKTDKKNSFVITWTIALERPAVTFGYTETGDRKKPSTGELDREYARFNLSCNADGSCAMWIFAINAGRCGSNQTPISAQYPEFDFDRMATSEPGGGELKVTTRAKGRIEIEFKSALFQESDRGLGDFKMGIDTEKAPSYITPEARDYFLRVTNVDGAMTSANQDRGGRYVGTFHLVTDPLSCSISIVPPQPK